MSNVYLKNTIKKTQNLLEWYSKLQFSKFKMFVSKSVSWELHDMQISLNFQTSCCNFLEQNCVAFLFLFWKGLWRFKVKQSLLFVEQKQTLIKTRWNWKWKILHIVLKTVPDKQFFKLLLNWQQWDSNPLPLNSYTNTQPISQTDQMIELCWDYLSVLIGMVHLTVC